MINLVEISKKFNLLLKEVVSFGEVKVVLVTKYVSDSTVLVKLSDIGVTDLAENYAQNLEKRFSDFCSLNEDFYKYNWHFIGHLQSNKVKKVVPKVVLIQSVDSFSLLAKIDEESKSINKVQSCLLELKVSEEETKFGIKEDDICKVLDENVRARFQNVEIVGLMTMAPYFEDKELARPYFKRARWVFENIKSLYKDKLQNFKWLSMGMSNDYLVALEEGANMIRIGSKIFGEVS